jgi:hypothetical protein
MYLWQERLGLNLACESGDDEHQSALPLQHALDHLYLKDTLVGLKRLVYVKGIS